MKRWINVLVIAVSSGLLAGQEAFPLAPRGEQPAQRREWTKRVLRGHVKSAHSLAFSPDGKLLASGGPGQDGEAVGRGHGQGAGDAQRTPLRGLRAGLQHRRQGPGFGEQRRRGEALGPVAAEGGNDPGLEERGGVLAGIQSRWEVPGRGADGWLGGPVGRGAREKGGKVGIGRTRQRINLFARYKRSRRGLDRTSQRSSWRKSELARSGWAPAQRSSNRTQ